MLNVLCRMPVSGKTCFLAPRSRVCYQHLYVLPQPQKIVPSSNPSQGRLDQKTDGCSDIKAWPSWPILVQLWRVIVALERPGKLARTDGTLYFSSLSGSISFPAIHGVKSPRNCACLFQLMYVYMLVLTHINVKLRRITYVLLSITLSPWDRGSHWPEAYHICHPCCQRAFYTSVHIPSLLLGKLAYCSQGNVN